MSSTSDQQTENQNIDAIAEQIDKASHDLNQLKTEINKKIFGQDDVVDQLLISLIAGSHSLLVGVPGLAKTLLIETLGRALDLQSNRIQFTPDLLPLDIIGSEIMNEDSKGNRSFRFVQGPLFSELLLADEINRASPRTQSALLQAMQEKQVSVGGDTRELPKPFHVLATQNPIEQDGTFPLPEAQKDRFLLEIIVPYPDLESEERIIKETTRNQEAMTQAVMSKEQLLAIQTLVRQIPLPDGVLHKISNLVRLGRADQDNSQFSSLLRWAPGPRAGQALALGVKARALMDGRYAPDEDDVKALANAVLRHRLALNFEARSEGLTTNRLIDEMVAHIWKS